MTRFVLASAQPIDGQVHHAAAAEPSAPGP